MTEPTNLSDKQRDDIEKVGRWLLGALDVIAQWADAQLKREQPVDEPNEITWISTSASLAEVRPRSFVAPSRTRDCADRGSVATTKPGQQDVSHLSRGIRRSTNGRGSPCSIL